MSKRLIAIGAIFIITGIGKLFLKKQVELFDFLFPLGLGAGILVYGLILLKSEKDTK